MDFAPLLDVNTNRLNPVIGIRAFNCNPDEVIASSEPVYKKLMENKIIPVNAIMISNKRFMQPPR